MEKISKYVIGNPIETGAVVMNIAVCENTAEYLNINEDNTVLTYSMSENDRIYGMGEAVRGINKRGWIYETYCSDDPLHTETKRSLYGAHPFIIVDGVQTFGVFVDYGSKIQFDIGYSRINELKITVQEPDYTLYIIHGETPLDIVKSFRRLIGKSYIAPKWAFGFQQCRWSYFTEQEVQNIIDGYRENDFPIDAVYLDIDYMEDYKDFTVNEERFPRLDSFAEKCCEKGIHLVPIIDAGVKIEDGYDVYEQGRDQGYFCKDKNGNDFVAAVWPGKVCFPDFLNAQAAEWFGNKYKVLLDMGIDGFWNDMNEPAIFYSENRLEKAIDKISSNKGRNLDLNDFFAMKDAVLGLANSADDYSSMYHNIDGTLVCHDRVHNLYGYNMTKAASQAFERLSPDKRILMFSRASYIGMHRYSGIWMGDNQSWWSHIKLNLQMLPSLNMCGFMYTGADMVGFGDNCTEELALRWLALGIFNPLMRNHAALGTRNQEFFRFENIDLFRNLTKLRYALIPYLYSEYLKSVHNFDMMFKPLSFVYRDDEFAQAVEDQLMVGDSIMIAPVYEPNALGRYVYIPEDMLAVTFKSENDYSCKEYSKGHCFIKISCGEVVVFIRKNRLLPLAKSADCTANQDYSKLKVIGYVDTKAVYELYDDDGISRNENIEISVITAENDDGRLKVVSNNPELQFGN